jgi:hypothetical protein
MAALAALSTDSGWADDAPRFHDSELTIPRVDTEEQVGAYQDATLSLQADGRWQLERVSTASAAYIKVPLEAIEVVKTTTVPVSVYLRTSGWVWPCGYAGAARIQQRLSGSHFDVAILVPEYVSPEPYACAAYVESVRLTVPLQVYGLAAGTYTYSVNNVSGSFTLDGANKFADDCRAGTVEPSYTVNWCPQ